MREFPSLHSSIVVAVEDGGSNPAPADCEVRSVIKFLNAHSIAPIEVHRQLCTPMATHGFTVNTSPAVVRLGGV